MASASDAQIDQRQVFLVFRKIFKESMPKEKTFHQIRREIWRVKRTDPHAKQLMLDHELDVVIKAIQSLIEEELFTTPTKAIDRFGPSIEEEKPQAVDDTYEPGIDPIPIPFGCQNLLMTQLQKSLERVCYHWAKRHMTSVLNDRLWDCVESLELTDFVDELKQMQSENSKSKWPQSLITYFETTPQERTSDHLFRSIRDIRHTAVHRERTTAKGIEKFLLDAERFAKAFEADDPEGFKAIVELRSKVLDKIEDMRKEKRTLQSRLKKTREKMEKKRARLEEEKREKIEAILTKMEKKRARLEQEEKKKIDAILSEDVDEETVGAKLSWSLERAETSKSMPAITEDENFDVNETNMHHDASEPAGASVSIAATPRGGASDIEATNKTQDGSEPLKTSKSIPSTREVDIPDVNQASIVHVDTGVTETSNSVPAAQEVHAADIDATTMHSTNTEPEEPSIVNLSVVSTDDNDTKPTESSTGKGTITTSGTVDGEVTDVDLADEEPVEALPDTTLTNLPGEDENSVGHCDAEPTEASVDITVTTSTDHDIALDAGEGKDEDKVGDKVGDNDEDEVVTNSEDKDETR